MRYQRNNQVAARTVADARLLIRLDGAPRSVYTLNAAGCRLWELLAQPRTEASLAAALLEAYELSAETAQHDVRVFLDDLVRLHLAEEVA